MKTRGFLAFIAAVLLAGVPAHGAARLYEIFVQRFVADDSGATILDLGTLDAQGQYHHYTYVQLGAGTVVPAEAMNKNLLPLTYFPVYDVLGGDALGNFRFGSLVTVNGQNYFTMAVADQPKLDVGTVPNLSARGAVSAGGEPLVGGFAIVDHPRRVLLRGVGPTLAQFGVGAPLANPAIAVFQAGAQVALASNDDWGQQANADEIEAAAGTVGAFALPRGSKDAVLLLELPPGNYTAQVSGAGAGGAGSGAAGGGGNGTALLEIYLLP